MARDRLIPKELRRPSCTERDDGPAPVAPSVPHDLPAPGAEMIPLERTGGPLIGRIEQTLGGESPRRPRESACATRDRRVLLDREDRSARVRSPIEVGGQSAAVRRGEGVCPKAARGREVHRVRYLEP